jgi:NADH-quinone oxidoreductase subunit M
MILVWLILIPFIGGLLSWQSERSSRGTPRWIALATMVATLGMSLWLWVTGDYSITGTGFAAAAGELPQWTVEFRAQWIPSIGASIHLGLDGLSLMLVVLTNLIGVLAIACSWKEIERNVGFFHLNLLWNLGGVVGIFLALDMFLFFFFWEMMLVPMYFLIALWGHNIPGGKGRVYAAIKFFIFTQASGFLMLIGILAMVWLHYQATGVMSFDYHDLLNTPMSAQAEWWLMLGFFGAFAVKMPIVPLHSWLPDAHGQAPTAGSVDLAGILLKTAAYGLLRFGIPFFPNASAEFAPVAMWFGVIGIIYGAVVAFSQTDIKRLVAYTSISHMGFIVIGIYAGTEEALQGVVVQMIAHGLSAGALFVLCGEIYERLHTRDLRQMGGLWARFPNLPPILLFFCAASLGLPGMGNFVGEFLILVGSFSVAPVVTIVAASGLILAAVYSLILVQRALHGPPQPLPANAYMQNGKLKDLSKRELVMMFSLMAMLLGLGLYPQPIIETARAPVQAVHAIYSKATGTAPVQSADAMTEVTP